MLENIYKIKIRSNPNPMEQYPSERRYSSSIVLGLSVMFLALGVTSTLMGTLVVRRITVNATEETESNVTEEDNRLLKRVEQDMLFAEPPEDHPINILAVISSGSFIMSLGLFLAGLAGLLAWKQWYVDNNITWFFLSSCFSAITSAISLLLITLTIIDCKEIYLTRHPPFSFGLTINIFITSLLGLVWSVVASNVAFRGMKNNYPEDIVLAKSAKGRVEVSTVLKGNKRGKVVPPDILDHFPTTGKLAKHFPRKKDGNMPKDESKKEYDERVKKFLAGGGGGNQN